MKIRFDNGIVVEFPKGTKIGTINTVERALNMPKPERDRVLAKAKAKLTLDNFVEAKDFSSFRKEVRRGIDSVTKMEGPQGERGSRFIGAFETLEDLPDPNEMVEGDFVLIKSTGEIWYNGV